MTTLNKPLSKKILAGIFSLFAGGIHAQMLEEVIVSAQKRAQSAQDVPISVHAVSSEFMTDNGIDSMVGLAVFVPNLTIVETPGANQILIRGMGSGYAGRSFEQSVGLYVDGIYAPRAAQFQVPFLDVERVEVLRGPQGVLFGKNSIAGAVSVHTAKPTSEFDAEITGKYGLEFDGYDIEAFVSGPLSGTLYGRLVAKFKEEGPYIDNTHTGGDEPDGDTQVVRMSMIWDASDTTEVTLKLEKSNYESQGSQFQYSDLDPDRAGSALGETLIDAVLQLGEDYQLDKRNSSNFPHALDIESNNLTWNVKQALGEHELTYIGGYSQYDREWTRDSDYGPVEFVNSLFKSDYKQLSHELRLTSPLGSQFEYVVGAYYISRELDIARDRDDITIPDSVPSPIPGFTANTQYLEDTNAWSIFGQLTWNLSDYLRVAVGARYTDESKEGRARLSLYDLASESTSSPFVPLVAAVFGINEFDLSDDRSETGTDPMVNLQWDFHDSAMAYITWVKAAKAGGFDAATLTGNPDEFQFDSEEAESVEIGVKAEFLNGRARLNMAAFKTDFRDLQVSSFNGFEFRTTNAADAESKGVELEASFAVSEQWLLGLNWAHLDSVYKDFLAQCPANAAQWGVQCAETNGQTQNLSGKKREYAPEWSGNVFAEYSTNITEALGFSARLDGAYTDDFLYQPEQDAFNSEDAYWLWNVRVALDDGVNERWTVALSVYNAADERKKGNGLGVVQQPGAYLASIIPPREVELSATYRF